MPRKNPMRSKCLHDVVALITYGLEVPRDADKVGAYWERRKIIHATNFIIDAHKKVTQACFATGPIGRIVAEDALRSIKGAKNRKAQGS